LEAEVHDERRRALEASERRLSERVGELSGQLVAANDLVASLEGQLRAAGGASPSDAELVTRLEDERDRARSETLRLTAQLAALETRVEGMRLGYEVRIAMLGADAVGAGDAKAASPTGTDAAIERELERVRAELASHRGEREGLRMRVAELEASRTALGSALPPQLSLAELDRLRDEVAALRAENGELTVRRVDLEQGLVGAEQRAADLAQKIAARDALVMRLQMDLAEEEQAARRDREHVVRAREELQRLREALVESSKAVDAKERAEARLAELREAFGALERRAIEAEVRVEALEASGATAQAEVAAERAAREAAELRAGEVAAQLAASSARLVEAEAEVRAATERAGEGEGLRGRVAALEGELAARDALLARRESAIGEVRGGLVALRRELDGWRVDEGTAQRRTEITAVGIDAPAEEVSRLVRLEREVEDKDTLLRSLTAQLEERDDRLRALERRLAEEGVQAGSDEEVRRELLELQERVERLHDELSHEREARGLAEDELNALRRRPVVADEVARLERALRERESALTEVTTRAGAYERDVESLRRVCAEARDGLESLLGAASDRGDPRTAERIGELLGVLSRFG
ncbi:MAG: hypothetical protein KF901_31770, partial [Myxococcales bacterium]|nr:hypothetical protein [Myxococcales bacterium]